MSAYAYELIPAVSRRNGAGKVEKLCAKCNRWYKVTSGGFTTHVQTCKADPRVVNHQPPSPVRPDGPASPSPPQSPNAALLTAILVESRETNRLLAALLAVWTAPKDDLA